MLQSTPLSMDSSAGRKGWTRKVDTKKPAPKEKKEPVPSSKLIHCWSA